MGIFDDGYCEASHCDEGMVPRLDTKTWEYNFNVMVACPECMGTGRNLTSMGRELVEFLKDIKGRI